MPSAFGVWGATPEIKDVKRLRTNYGRIERSALFRGENSNPSV
jgi:hypothetical protein